jgi:hypothetical protein
VGDLLGNAGNELTTARLKRPFPMIGAWMNWILNRVGMYMSNSRVSTATGASVGIGSAAAKGEFADTFGAFASACW